MEDIRLSRTSLLDAALIVETPNMLYCLTKINPVSGVLGMGWGPRSFVADQLGSISDGEFSYCIKANSINVNGVELNISKTDLAIEKDGGGGCVIDCGTLATLLVKPIFDTLHTALADHLSSNQNLKRRIIHKLPKDLCCEELLDDGRKNLPVVTSHFENAGLDVKPEAVFMFREFEGKILFCFVNAF
ncbi:uncharacterized protein LOC133702017 [Populus nigra]|uniref:uncharacterized protein LOC133702017 n=1 Tax=Populus nigra TaxID=3691 RepID=UPI002B279865|nr:uncharacterized protein LOC133702017 [Populus nigra]